MSGPGPLPAEDGTSERERRSLPLDRFNAFSDGVFAIAITLLVLEIAIPRAGVPVLPALREQWPEFLGYYISFAFIGGIWIAHAGVTKFMKSGDPASFSLNLLLLLFVGLLPFSTALMAGSRCSASPAATSCCSSRSSPRADSSPSASRRAGTWSTPSTPAAPAPPRSASERAGTRQASHG